MPLAPLSAVVYLTFEWLFLVTKPSPTSALPVATQLRVLLESPLPALLPLLGVQAIASALSVIAFPRLRGLALVPAAFVCGFLCLVLIDNFTYTLFGVGITRSGEVLRIVYTIGLCLIVGLVGWKLHSWLASVFLRVGTAPVSLAITAVVLSVPLVAAARQPSRHPDASVLPALEGSAAGRNRPNILFLGADGLDAALLSAYGYPRPTTPFLESIREDTLFFENAFSNAARTHGSLVTLLTGRSPFSTHVTFPPTLLQGEDSSRTLPALLKRLGYTTLQIGMRHYADAEDANIQGFDAANYRWQRLEDASDGAPAFDETDVFRTTVAERIDERLGRLLALSPAADGFAHVEGRQVVPQWRDERRVTTLVEYFEQAPEPWFVHLHMLDTHCCQWLPDRLHFSGSTSPDIDARDSQIRETDNNIRTLFESLEETGLLERTIVVVNSDHASHWKITERVPLMIRFPNRELRGRVSTNVQLADVAPTMLAYLKAPVPTWMDGQPLLPVGATQSDRRIFGVSDVEARTGPSGARHLLESGPPNYGVSSVMLVDANQWFEMSLDDGDLVSGRVKGHTGDAATLTEPEARALLLDRIRSAGFEIREDTTHATAAVRRTR
ncbi:MAG: sulfatase [Acidobacteria bacterium]|nr:sulfatase [Acidobacteriota bacterium]